MRREYGIRITTIHSSFINYSNSARIDWITRNKKKKTSYIIFGFDVIPGTQTFQQPLAGRGSENLKRKLF